MRARPTLFGNPTCMTEVFVLGSVSSMGIYLNQLHYPNVRISSSPGEHDPLRSMLHRIIVAIIVKERLFFYFRFSICLYWCVEHR